MLMHFSEELFTEKANFPQVKMIELKLARSKTRAWRIITW
jgi:hypothetical protein